MIGTGGDPREPPGARPQGQIANKTFRRPAKPGDETCVSDLALGAGPGGGPVGTPGTGH